MKDNPITYIVMKSKAAIFALFGGAAIVASQLQKARKLAAPVYEPPIPSGEVPEMINNHPVVEVPPPVGFNVTDKAMEFIAREEGNIPYPYPDPPGSGKFSIGIGHQIKPGENHLMLYSRTNPIPPGLVQDLFIGDIQWVMALIALIPVPLRDNEIVALASFIYNIGEGNWKISRVRQLLYAGKVREAADYFVSFSRSGDNTSILRPRRLREKALYLS